MTQDTQSHEPTNVQRAEWAKAALAVFTHETFGGDNPDAMTPGDLEDAITDLICDLLHLAHFHPRMAATTVHTRALDHFQQEVSRDEACDCADRSWYGPYHDVQCPVGIRSREPGAPNASELFDALEGLLVSLSPRKIAPVLKAAGYSTEIWLVAHRRARTLLNQFQSIGGRP
jgi:hypothetical protein